MRRESTYQEGSSMVKLLMGKEITSLGGSSMSQAPGLQHKEKLGSSPPLKNT